MNKSDTLELKGVAILMMLYLHLFNNINNVSLCSPSLYVADMPLLYLLTRMTKPVHLFLILGGYGQYCIGGGKRLQRIGRLYLLYWLILSVFVSLGVYLKPNSYPGTSSDIVLNFSGLDTTYNRECWFLFPYVLLIFCSSWFFRRLKTVKWYFIIGITLLLSVLVSMFFRFYGIFVDDKWYLIQPLEFLSFFFPFFVGVLLAREKVIERMYRYKNKIYWWFICIVLVAIRCCFQNNTLVDIAYCTGFILSYTMAPHWSCVSNFFRFVGKESSGMWLIHSWICYYLFHDQLYSLHNPFMIFVSLVIFSYILSRLFGQFIKLIPVKR